MNKSAIKTMKKYSIIRALLNGSLEPEEVMRAYDIFPRLVSLEMDVAAFVYRSRKDRFYIIVNKSLNDETRRGAFFHELCHIIEDMPREGYMLGLDMQRHVIEGRADMFFKEIAAVYAIK